MVWRNTALARRLSLCWSRFQRTFDSGTTAYGSGLNDISALPLEKTLVFPRVYNLAIMTHSRVKLGKQVLPPEGDFDF